MKKLIAALLLSCVTYLPAFADIVHIPADQDTTLIEDADGALSNGAGPAFFAGRTNQSMFSIRRALLRFDVAAALPENALIDRVFLTLYQGSNNVTPSDVSLHLVLADWGEGASFSGGGGGAAAEPGDATWLHTFHDYDYWVQQGGLFVPHASATTIVLGKGFYTWASTVFLENNVLLWLQAPEHNYGWLVMGDEDTRGSVKSFYSRECFDAAVEDKYKCAGTDQRPMLTIEYHLPGE